MLFPWKAEQMSSIQSTEEPQNNENRKYYLQYGFRRPALLTFFIMFWSNVGFIFLGNIPEDRRYFAMIFRFFVGIAAG